MMLPSGNDAAEQVAVALADSREQYVDWMNQEAAALGLKDTHFVNPSGMDADGHYSSAYDMAMLARYAMRNATFRDLAGTKHYTGDGFDDGQPEPAAGRLPGRGRRQNRLHRRRGQDDHRLGHPQRPPRVRQPDAQPGSARRLHAAVQLGLGLSSPGSDWRTRYFEDFLELQAIAAIELGSYTFTAEASSTLPAPYDPQAMHIDPEAARQLDLRRTDRQRLADGRSYMRMLVDSVLADSESLGSPGIDNLRWLKPVRPGDTLRGRFTVLEAKLSRSRPDRGIVRSRGEMVNQHDEVVMQLEAVNFFGRRPPAERSTLGARAAATRLAISAALAPAPTPLSMLTTTRPGAHVWSMDSSAAIPPPPRP